MNELERAFRSRITIKIQTVPDKRYRVLVNLQRSDRPRYWNFLCMNCGSKLVELQGLEVLAISDFFDPSHVANAGIGKHCKGTLRDGLPCQYSYFFNVQ